MGFNHTSLIFGTGGDGLGGLWLLRDAGVSAFFYIVVCQLKEQVGGCVLEQLNK